MYEETKKPYHGEEQPLDLLFEQLEVADQATIKEDILNNVRGGDNLGVIKDKLDALSFMRNFRAYAELKRDVQEGKIKGNPDEALEYDRKKLISNLQLYLDKAE